MWEADEGVDALVMPRSRIEGVVRAVEGQWSMADCRRRVRRTWSEAAARAGGGRESGRAAAKADREEQSGVAVGGPEGQGERDGCVDGAQTRSESRCPRWCARTPSCITLPPGYFSGGLRTIPV